MTKRPASRRPFCILDSSATNGAFWWPSSRPCDRPSSQHPCGWTFSLRSSSDHPSSLLPLCSLSMKELNYSASPPVELPTDAASEQARVVTTCRNILRNTLQPRANIGTTEIARNNLFLRRCIIVTKCDATMQSVILPNAARGLHLTSRVSLARRRTGRVTTSE